MRKGKYTSKIKTVMEHIYDYFPKISAKNIPHLRYIQLTERKNLIDLPYLDNHSFYF
jgi:hypothetical protein